jgi:hypothetical protein
MKDFLNDNISKNDNHSDDPSEELTKVVFILILITEIIFLGENSSFAK